MSGLRGMRRHITDFIKEKQIILKAWFLITRRGI